MRKWAKIFKKAAHWFISIDAADLLKSVDMRTRKRTRATITIMGNGVQGESTLAETVGVLAVDAGCGLFCVDPDLEHFGDAVATAVECYCEWVSMTAVYLIRQ